MQAREYRDDGTLRRVGGHHVVYLGEAPLALVSEDGERSTVFDPTPGGAAWRVDDGVVVSRVYTDPSGGLPATAEVADPWGDAWDLDPPAGPPACAALLAGFDAPPRLGFHGHLWDPASRLMWFGARNYLPEVGQFDAPEPRAPEPDRPLSFLPYAYAACDPVHFADRGGRVPLLDEGVERLMGLSDELLQAGAEHDCTGVVPLTVLSTLVGVVGSLGALANAAGDLAVLHLADAGVDAYRDHRAASEANVEALFALLTKLRGLGWDDVRRFALAFAELAVAAREGDCVAMAKVVLQVYDLVNAVRGIASAARKGVRNVKRHADRTTAPRASAAPDHHARLASATRGAGSGADAGRVAEAAQAAAGLPSKIRCYGRCIEFAENLQQELRRRGISGVHIRIERQGFGIGDIRGSGRHVGVGVHDGVRVDDVVFDNLNTGGIAYTKWRESLRFISDPSVRISDEFVVEEPF